MANTQWYSALTELYGLSHRPVFSLGCFEGHRALPAPLGGLFEAINLALYPP